jgi:hypothetical protein
LRHRFADVCRDLIVARARNAERRNASKPPQKLLRAIQQTATAVLLVEQDARSMLAIAEEVYVVGTRPRGPSTTTRSWSPAMSSAGTVTRGDVCFWR